MTLLAETLSYLAGNHLALSREQARAVMQEILADTTGALPDAQIAALLGALSARPATAEELTGFAEAMRAAAASLPLTDDDRAQILDTCGTGGDASGTFNISTAVALVAAGAGAKIAKHGNRSVSSRCGSADVLEALGVPVSLDPRAAVQCLRSTGFVFLFAPKMHPAMARVQPLRRALGVRTIFNLLGPLTNPAGAAAQVLGVYAVELVQPMAEAMAALGVRRGLVVHGRDGLDEITLGAETEVAEVRDGAVRRNTFQPEDAGLPRAPVSELQGGDALENAAILRRIFAGERGPRRDVVLVNAAAALMTAGLEQDLRAAVARAAEAIDSGAVQQVLNRLIEFGAAAHSR